MECLTCGRLVCTEHYHAARSGEFFCQECFQRNGPQRIKTSETPILASAPAAKPRAESLSFDQLSAEFGDDIAEEAARARQETPVRALEAGTKPENRIPSNDPKQFRVLTASSPQGTPIWLSGLFAGGMACVLLLPLFQDSGFRGFQPWYSYAVMMMGFSAVFWSGYGLVRRGEPALQRGLCVIGFLLGLISFITAFVLRSPQIRL